MDQSDAPKGTQPTRDLGADVEGSQSLVQSLVDTNDPEHVRLKVEHNTAVYRLLGCCDQLKTALNKHLREYDDNMLVYLAKNSQTLSDLSKNVFLKFQSHQDEYKLSECHRQPPGWRAGDRRHEDNTEVHHPSEEEMKFCGSLDATMEELSRLNNIAAIVKLKWDEHKARVKRTESRSALNELKDTEPEWDERRGEILRRYGTTEGNTGAVGDDAAGESTTLETEPPQIPGAANAINLSGEDSGSPSQGDQGQPRRIRPRLE